MPELLGGGPTALAVRFRGGQRAPCGFEPGPSVPQDSTLSIRGGLVLHHLGHRQRLERFQRRQPHDPTREPGPVVLHGRRGGLLSVPGLLPGVVLRHCRFCCVRTLLLFEGCLLLGRP